MHAADAVLSGGVRRCIAKGQKVITRDGGYKNIEDIIVGDMVSTPNGWEPVTNTFIQGTQKTIKIIHQDGELICTPNHRVAVMDGHESFTWKQASELEKGDRLLFIRNIASGQKTSLPQFSYNKPPHSTTCKDIQIPELDADIAWLLGIIHGGDYVYLTSKSGYISVAIHGDDTLQAIKVKQCLERFGVDVQISPPREEDNCYRINCKSKQLAQYFQDFLKKPKQPIIIPRCIVEAIPEIRVAYLQGVLDSDGSLKTKPLHAVTTIYRDFAVQLQNLYATLGIKTRLKKLSTKNLKVGWYPKYSLSVINNIDRKKFNSISSNGFKKFRIFRACRNANSFKPEWFEEAVKPKHFHGHCCVQNKRISVDAYEKIYQHNRYVPVEILRIEEHGEVETFDIEVKSDHCFICESVLVHNSATICFFSEDDEEMMQAKTGDWYYTNKQRSRANITVPLLRNGLTRERFQKLFNYTKEYGEPGIALVDSLEALFNPCGEAGFYCYSAEGKSGFQFCNLTSINGKKCDTAEKFYKACETAAIIGTLQATFTDFPYLGSVTEEITRREALLGVSINGIMEHTNILLDPEVQSEGARIVRETNEKWAKILGINPSARSTVMKPEGTSSCLLGSASGMRPHHAKRYLRYVQANLTENVYQFLKAKNPIACQKSYWSANDESNTDGMAIFAIEVPDGSKTKDDLTAIEFLKNISLTYKHWIQGGKNIDLCVQPWISHNISNTVNVRDHEWEEVIDYVFNHLEDFCALSFLPIAGDKDYMQAPNTTVYTPREIVSEYGDASIFASGVIEKALEAFDHLWIACDVILDIKKLEQMTTEQEYWLIKAQRFTDKYFGGDTKKMTYCLKDVFNWKLYTDLQNHMVSMDYSEMVEEEDNTTFDTEVACAGGACTI
jgi:intein/homing endonuclease